MISQTSDRTTGTSWLTTTKDGTSNTLQGATSVSAGSATSTAPAYASTPVEKFTTAPADSSKPDAFRSLPSSNPFGPSPYRPTSYIGQPPAPPAQRAPDFVGQPVGNPVKFEQGFIGQPVGPAVPFAPGFKGQPVGSPVPLDPSKIGQPTQAPSNPVTGQPVGGAAPLDPSTGVPATGVTGAARASACKDMVALLDEAGAKYSHDRTDFDDLKVADCSKFVQLALERAGQGDLFGRAGAQTGLMRDKISELSGPDAYRKSSPKAGDIMMWDDGNGGGHVAMVTGVDPKTNSVKFAMMGNSGANEYTWQLDNIQGSADHWKDKKFANGDFLGFWTPPST